jgi:hypothetical protein
MATRNYLNSNGAIWTLGGSRRPKELEAQNIVIDIAEPDFLSDDTKRRILVTVIVVVAAVAVSLGVVLSQNSGSSSPPPIANETSPTAGPTASPSALSGPSMVDQFLRDLPAYSIKLAENDPNSPQAKALAWLRDDPLFNEYDLYRLFQRYALAVLYYSTNGESWVNSTGWLSYDHECDWYALSSAACGYVHRVRRLDFYKNGLNGSIPTELALLSELQYVSFVGDGEAFSVAIYSELYVLEMATGALPRIAIHSCSLTPWLLSLQRGTFRP